MSCVADATATASAHQTIGSSASRGSVKASPIKAAMMTLCDSSNQLRRLPSQRVSKKIGSRSTSGAQTHLKP